MRAICSIAFTEYGIGCGLRDPHFLHITDKEMLVDWFESISQGYIIYGGHATVLRRRLIPTIAVLFQPVAKHTLPTHLSCGMPVRRIRRRRITIHEPSPMYEHRHPFSGCQGQTQTGASPQRIPPIVRIVLTQAAQHRMRGWITAIKFEAQVERLSREELEPRGLSVLVRHLVCGTERFIIKKTATGQVWDMIEIEPNDVPTKNIWQVDPQG